MTVDALLFDQIYEITDYVFYLQNSVVLHKRPSEKVLDTHHKIIKLMLPCLVLVREPRVERCGFDVGGRFDHLRHDAATKHNLVIEIILYLEYFL